jgi:drug/metabolite transporter (DMT)-like permease
MAVGFFGGFAGRYLNLLAMKLTGLARASVVSQTVLVWSAALAVGILGERMTLRVGLGTLAIMFGASFLVYQERADIRERIPMHYYLVPASSALMYAFAHLAGKNAFSWIPSSPFGMAVANTMSFTLVLSMMPFTQEGRKGHWEWKGLIVLLGSSVFQAVGILFFWSAVKTGQVTQVIPLSRLSLLLIIFLSWLLFRKQEAVTWRVVAGGLLALAGAFWVAGGK